MNTLIDQIDIKVNDKLYLKDPTSSELGKRIVADSINLIDEIGLESFTFKKLAKQLDTTESSIYRYFENKNKLLIYLTSWYWGWMEYQLVFATANLTSPENELQASLKVIAEDIEPGSNYHFIKLDVLDRILISESSKAYLTKEVDDANKIGSYAAYKRVVSRVSDIVLRINPNFKYPHTLISTIVEGIHHQKYFADHLSSLTDIRENSSDLGTFYTDMALAIIKQ